MYDKIKPFMQLKMTVNINIFNRRKIIKTHINIIMTIKINYFVGCNVFGSTKSTFFWIYINRKPFRFIISQSSILLSFI